MLLLFLTWKHDGCFIPQFIGQHLQSSKTPADLKREDEDETTDQTNKARAMTGSAVALSVR